MNAMSIVATPTSLRGGGLARGIAVVILAPILAGAAYEAAIATGIIGLGSAPGEGARGGGLLTFAIFALLGAGVLFVAAAIARPLRDGLAASFVIAIDVAAFVLALARWLSYDSYYAPTLRRLSDGWISGEVLLLLAGIVAAAVIVTVLRLRAGLLVSTVAVLACALLTVIAGAGH